MNEKQLVEKIKSIEWEWEWGRQTNIFTNYVVLKAWVNAPEYLAGQVNNIVVINKDGYSNFFTSVKDLKEAGKCAYEFSVKKGFVKFFEKNARRVCKKLVKASKLKSNKDILDQYNEWAEDIKEVLDFVAHIRIFNRIGESKLKEFINSKINNPKEQVKIFSILSATTRRNAFNDFHKMMGKAYKIKEKGDKEELNKIIKKIVKNFKWIPVGYGDEPEWTTEDIKKQLEYFKPIKESKIDKDKIYKELEPSKEVLRLIEAIDLFVYYKDYLRRTTNYCYYYSKPIFAELAKKLNINYEEVKMLTPEEVNKIKPKESSSMFSDDGRIYNFDYIEELEEKLFSFKEEEIKGTVANVGKVKGEVVIINKPEDIKKDYKDKILVSVMTSPGMTPVIKESTAIVTDEGGITCHAAIISRELNVPCIIGTKIATKILKDGDLIEVDAERGIVRKLK